MTAPQGWYPDPSGRGGQRYFDGVVWTDHWSPPQQQVYPQTVVVNRGGSSDHAFHLVLTIFTCGLWLPVWVVMEIINAARK